MPLRRFFLVGAAALASVAALVGREALRGSATAFRGDEVVVVRAAT